MRASEVIDMRGADSSKQNPCPWCGGHAYTDAFIGDAFASDDPGHWPKHIVLEDGSSVLECRVWCSGCGAQGPHFDTGLVSHVDQAQPEIEKARNAWNAVASSKPHCSGNDGNVVQFRQ